MDKNNIKDIYSLSPMQQGILFHSLADESSEMYREQMAITVAGNLDVELLEKSLDGVVNQYDVLRTMFISKNVKEPVQLVLKDRKTNVYFEDITRVQKERSAYLAAFKKKDKEKGFDLAKDPLIRMAIFKTAERRYEIIISFHHIIMDGWSLGIILKDLFENYTLLKAGNPVKSIAPKPYSEFIKWIEKQEKDEGLAYWNQYLDEYEQKAEVPCGKKRNSEERQYTLGETTFTLSESLTNQLTELAKQKGTTLNIIFQIAWGILLHIYNYTEDVVFGAVVSGRPSAIQGIENMVGLFINTIPVRMKFEHSSTFNAIIEQITNSAFESTKYDYLPLAKIQTLTELKRDLINNIIIYENYPITKAVKNVSPDNESDLEILKTEMSEQTNYDFNLFVMPDKAVTIKFAYNANVYDEDQLTNVAGHLTKVLQHVADNPDQRLSSIEILLDKEKEQILNEFNDTKADYPKQTIHQLFEKQVKKTPNKIAVIFEGKSLTYQQLNQRANQIAQVLRAKGVKPNSIVGIMLERSLEMVAGMLGILKSGGAYLPISPDYPDDRVAYMLEDSRAELIITQNRIASRRTFQGEKIVVDDEASCDGTIENLSVINTINDLAYVMYTSGTTGKPKGVMIPHQALTNFLIAMKKQPGFTSQDKLLAVTTYCFDIAGLELFLPLINGGQCLICDMEKARDVEKLKKEIQQLKPTIMQATPVTWTMLSQAGWTNEEKVKILCGGEALPEKLKQYFMDTQSEVWNMFGPTETTIWSTVQRIEKDEPITIGKPIANTQIYILGKNMKPLPIGIPGELFIAGDGLAAGYLNKPELTAEKFISNPFCKGTKLYKTGDLACWLPDGNIEFLGRIDHQVKIRGFRIELGEIESQLNKHPELKDGVVVVKEQDGIKQLVAYYVRKPNSGKTLLDPQLLRDFLKTTLPGYMIPGIFVELAVIPLTSNGKIDRKELMKQSVEATGKRKESEPESEIEAQVLEIWKEVLKITDINTEEGFFEVGGDSLSAVSVAERIKNGLKCDFNVTTLFKYPNIKEISGYITKCQEEIAVKAERSNQNPAWDDGAGSLPRMVEKDAPGWATPDYYGDSLAIVGISCQVPGAKNHCEFWENLKTGKESIRFFTREELYDLNLPEELVGNPDYIAVQSAIEGKDLFEPGFFNISPREVAFMDPQLRLLLVHSWKALEDAGYIPEQIPDTGVFMSASNNFYQASAMTHSPNQVIQNVNDYMAWILGQGGTIPTMISYKLGLKGPSFFIHSNCSSSLAGLYSAYQSLIAREVKYALVGAATISTASNMGYVYQPGLNFSSDGHIKTFDASADGMIGGDGVGVILLKRADDAVKDGDHIYAILRGIGINNDGADKVGFYAPSVTGQVAVIEKVLNSKQIHPESIGYVEAHGTGTKIGDSIEFTALNEVYRKYTTQKQFCGLGSVKANIGHLDTAAGLASCIKVAMILENNEIPPSINYYQPNPIFDLDNSPFYIVNRLKKWEKSSLPHRAAMSSFGVGGTNTHVIFEQYPIDEVAPAVEPGDEQSGIVMVPLSAKNADRLKAYAKELRDFLNWNAKNKPDVKLMDLAYTLQVGRTAMESRVIFIVNSLKQLTEKLGDFITQKSVIEGCFWGERQTDKEISNLSGADGEPREWMDSWIAEGNVKKLGEFWVKGLSIDWNKLYVDHQPGRISLPTYPFAGKRYWIQQADAAKHRVNRLDEAAVIAPPPKETGFDESVAATMTSGATGSVSDTGTVNSLVLNKPSNIALQALSNRQIGQSVDQVQQAVALPPLGASHLQSERGSVPEVSEQTASMKEALSAKVAINSSKAQETMKEKCIAQVQTVRTGYCRDALSLKRLQEELSASLAEILYLEQGEIDIDKKFVEQGLDSIIGVEWVKGINKQFGTEIAATKVYDYPNVREFAGFLAAELRALGEAEANHGEAVTVNQPTSKVPVPAIAVPVAEITGSVSKPETVSRPLAAKEQNPKSLKRLQEELSASLAEILYLEQGEIDIDKKFIEQGLDSILGVEWVKILNKQYGTAIVATKVYDYPSIREFAEFIAAELRAQVEASTGEVDMMNLSTVKTQGATGEPLPVAEVKGNDAQSSLGVVSVKVAPQKGISLPALQEELAASLAEVLYMERDEIDMDKKFIEQGLDSIIGVEWVKKLNKRYGTDISATKVYDYPTVREFAKFLEGEMQVPISGLSVDEILSNVYQGTLDVKLAATLLQQMQERQR